MFTLFAQQLPNYSLNDSFSQTPPLRDANLRRLVRWSISFKAEAVLLCVQPLPGKQLFLKLQKAAPKPRSDCQPKSDFCANPIEIQSYLDSLNGN